VSDETLGIVDASRLALTEGIDPDEVVFVPLQKSRRAVGSGALVQWDGGIGDEGKTKDRLRITKEQPKKKATPPVDVFAAALLAPRTQVPRKAKRSHFHRREQAIFS